MRFAVYGASGRVGTKLVETILASPGMELAAAHISPASRWLGGSVGNTAIEYRPAEPSINAHCDAIIDFSTPDASIRLQEIAGDRPVPIVVGTTGFSAAQERLIDEAARLRPVMVGVNFALGFGAFAASVQKFASAFPNAQARIEETYHQRKKRSASGTSRLLADIVRNAQDKGGAVSSPMPEISIHRSGNVVGINEVHFDLGVSRAGFVFNVDTLGAYAEGALAAAVWLADPARKPGRYEPADMQG
jgi:4-hydroxy-tetrahydrodipicolinate reductase